ncbi:MAG: bile acid:sodium symporter [Gammaproteobacteria bacterium]
MSGMFLLEWLLAFLFVTASMLCIGMETGVAELRALFASRGLLMRALVANFMLVPLVGIALALLLPLRPEVAGALVLLACTPGALSAIQFTTKVKGEAPLAGAIFFLLSLLAILLSPTMLRLLLPAHVALALPHGRVLSFVVVFMLLPWELACSCAARRRASRRSSPS